MLPGIPRGDSAFMPLVLRPLAPPPSSPPQRRPIHLRAFLALSACVVAACLPALLYGSWVFDDLKFLLRAPRLESLEGLKLIWLDPRYDVDDFTSPLMNYEPHYWPLLYTTFRVERQLLGEFFAPGFRATNLAIHLVNVWLLWGLLRRFGVPGAWCIALVFAIHPGQMAGPAIILHRKDVLSATFVLLSIRLWLPGGRPCPALPWSRVLAVCGLLVAAALVKTTAALLPVYLVVVYWWRGGAFSRPALVRSGMILVLGFLVGLSLLLLTRHVSPLPYITFSLVERLCLVSMSFWLHLFFSLVPFPGVMRYWFWHDPSALVPAWCAVVAFLAVPIGVLHSLRATRHVCVAVLWFFVALFPYLGFMDHHSLGMSLAWPRHRYLASVAPIALVVGLAFWWVPRLWTFRARFSAPVVAAPFVAVCLVVDFGQSVAMTRPSAWTGYQLRYNPERLRTHLWHVWELSLEGDSERALEVARAGVLRFADSAQAHAGLAEVYAKRFERAHARAHYAAALRIIESDPSRVVPDDVPRPRVPVNVERVSPPFVFRLHVMSAALAACDGDGAEAARHRAAAAELYPEVSIAGYLQPGDPHLCLPTALGK